MPYSPTGSPSPLAIEAGRRTKASFAGTDLPRVVGITHVSGQYRMSPDPFLVEGAMILSTLGTKVIKLWLCGEPDKHYPFHSQWNGPFTSLLDVARHPYYREVFSMPFETYVLECMPVRHGDWRLGLDPAVAAEEAREIEGLTHYLATTYAGSGKTFVLQNWEGDNDIGLNGRPEAGQAVAIRGMIDWTNRRQAAVERGRRGSQGVRIAHALEMNWVPGGAEKEFGAPLVVDEVAPHTSCDLYSLSSWGTKSPGTEGDLEGKLDYIVGKTSPSGMFGRRNVMVGEFGAPESIYASGAHRYPSLGDDTGLQQLEVTRRQLESALAWGVPFLLYWELYCNEWKRADGGRDEHRPHQMAPPRNDELRGFWLIRPDGTATPTWDYFREMFRVTSPSSIGP